MLKKILNKFFAEPSGEGAATVRTRQFMRLGLLVSVGIVFVFVIIGMRSTKSSVESEPEKNQDKKQVTLAADSVDVRDVWSHRLMEQTDSQSQEMETLRAENKMLSERMTALEALKLDALKSDTNNQPGPDVAFNPMPGSEVAPPSLSGIPMSNPGQEYSQINPTQVFQKTKPKMTYISIEGDTPQQFHADSYVTAGTYSKAVLMSGLAVSTAVATQSNPQPIAIRLIDSGNLPRGWTSRVKDAVLIGSCYGDLSAERAVCRINTLSFTEADGTGVEIQVEGWLFGEDGAPGVRGKVIDRAGEVARESLIAGILGGMSNFLKNEATSSVFPVTPFGQTNALKTEDVLKGSAGTGASNALEKLADFSIKRAESMQPVIIVNGGRRVDVLFKKGFSLKPNVGNAIKVKGTS